MNGILDSYNKEKEKNKKLDRENQALYESINCDDNNMLIRFCEQQKQIIKELTNEVLECDVEYERLGYETELYDGDTPVPYNEYKIILNLIKTQQKELERYKRLAEMNLKDSEEFKENMCEHRCILNNQIMELTEELNNLKEIEKAHQEENEKLRVELTKQQKIINQMAEDRMSPQGCRTLYNVFNKQDVIDFYKKFVEESE